MTCGLRDKWFASLLAKDVSFYDGVKTKELPTKVTTTLVTYRRAVGARMGQGVQFTVMTVGGITVAFIMCWQVTLVTLGTLPLLAASGYWLVQVNQNAKRLTQDDYSRAGGVALEALQNLRTAISLNALWGFVKRYEGATAAAKRTGVRRGFMAGMANGSLFGR